METEHVIVAQEKIAQAAQRIVAAQRGKTASTMFVQRRPRLVGMEPATPPKAKIAEPAHPIALAHRVNNVKPTEHAQ